MRFSNSNNRTNSDKCCKSWNICMSHCDDHRKQIYKCYFFWNIQMFLKFGTYKSMDLWNGHLNLWIYGRNIRLYGYMEGNIYIQMRTKSGTYKSMV